ncbi:hypothetical protein [Tropicimonas sp. IMCC6043]|uniref:hypothetical protein n=1 Tax=Tropicimonas sp. IMCC6043 TaxID=2510645 RepID=UPI00101C37C8|nr:hypothetical protein [Tropicimonas sp. IMCC6043]RYH10640.1 hypothetical protein EU800_07830 [Tropicimonas sp. IMCC6043]
MSEGDRESGNAGRATANLVDGTYARLVHRAGTEQPAWVVFGDEERGPQGVAAAALGLDLAGADLYEILPRGKHWYPASETGPMAETLSRVKAGKIAVAVGASMGGYGALRYGARAGCTTVLAFAPQARITPGMRGIGARHAEHYRADLHAGMEIEPEDLPERAYAVIDPANPHDLLHAELLRHEAGVEVIALPHMGSHPERAMASPDIARTALAAAAAGDREGLARALRRGRRQDKGFLARLSMTCSERGHPAWGESIARMSGVAEDPAAPILHLALAMARARLGRPLEALEDIEALIVAAPRNLRYWNALAGQYQVMGFPEAAAEVYELALGETEHFSFCWKLILNRMAAGAVDEARLLTDLALEHWPDRAAQIARVRARLDAAA